MCSNYYPTMPRENATIGRSVREANDFKNQYGVTVKMLVTNRMSADLEEPKIFTKWGSFLQAPKIERNTVEAVLIHKTSFTLSGSSGTISWRVADTPKRVVVMWSVPNSYLVFSNRLAIGMIGNNDHNEDTFKKMYAKKGDFFTAGKYGHCGEVIEFSHSDAPFVITGMMGNDAQTTVDIEIRNKP